MTLSKKIQPLLEYLIILLFFIAGCNLFIYFKTAGLNSVFLDLGNRPFNPVEAHIKATLGGLFYGLVLIGFETLIYPKLGLYLKRGQRRFFWLLSIPLLIVGSIIIINAAYSHYVLDSYWEESVVMALEFVKSSLFISFLVYGIFMSLAVSFVRQLRINFGETVFLNYLYGKYSNPLVERRTFMFLDLNNSTHIAESLGHVKYSRFLNKCFNDILNALQTFRFDIYQFVGDEIVFTWEIRKDNDGKAIKMYSAIQKALEGNQGEYARLFGFAPVFKAAASSGSVTATIVGKRKKSIAYHGDVLNTTARLLGLCKPLKSPLLFTDFYLKNLRQPLFFKPKFLTELKLQGKNNSSKIYAPENMMMV